MTQNYTLTPLIEQADLVAAELRRECAGECCGGTIDDVEVTFYANRHWRGWVAYCLKCARIIKDVDYV
jgi:hypothetical protein